MMLSKSRVVMPPSVALPIVAAFLILAAGQSAPQAAEKTVTHAYVVPADDGYGLTECLALGGECAHVVADAWCESHGHAHSVALGTAEDVTGALAAQPVAVKIEGDEDLPVAASYVVTCGE